MHVIGPRLLHSRVRIAVIGCGGTGSAVIGGLPHLHQAMLAGGHQHGLTVTIYDGDRISETNSVRQPFSTSEIGLFKSVVLINRLNLFWGLEWEAVPKHITESREINNQLDLVIGCVDTRAARAIIHKAVTSSWCSISYVLDIGNNAESGQFVLGPPLNQANKRKAGRLRTAYELWPEVMDAALEDDTEPSCSAAEALERQRPLSNARHSRVRAAQQIISW